MIVKRILLIGWMVMYSTEAFADMDEIHIHEIIVGSKTFTESVILGEIAAQSIRSIDFPVYHRRELGGSRFVWNALIKGDIDTYCEYTGTLRYELLASENLQNDQALREAIEAMGIGMTEPLGFNNTYAIGMKEEHAKRLNITKISDLLRFPDFRFGFSNEFMDRQDGWPNFQRHYNLPQQRVKGLQHDLAYRGLDNGDIDAIDVYTTDAEIAHYNLRVLEDDLNYFPEYNAVFLYRSELALYAPEVVDQLTLLEEALSAETMIRLNEQVKIKRVSEQQTASEFLFKQFGIESNVQTHTVYSMFWIRTKEHVILVLVSLACAILVAIPLGILSAKMARLGHFVLGVVGIIQTIPALALLVLMIPFVGIGTAPALLALFLYSLLPIVRNTYAGLQNIPTDLRESAEALGLPSFYILVKIEIPLAMRSIFAGIKTSAVLNIGFATLGALIGAGGYGQPILTGIRLDDIGLILQGAVPAALLALLTQFFFDRLERWIIPTGLQYDIDH